MFHILLAEDNPGDVFLVQRALHQHHVVHHLCLVRDGEAALQFIASMGTPGNPPCPDLMLLDINLPKIDGPQILQEFRRRSECVHTPVIVVTSSDAPVDRQSMAGLGVTCFFRKPLDLAEFMELGAIVRKIVEE